MKSVHSMEKKKEYLYYTISGEYDRADFTSYAALILKECGKQNVHKVLVNALNVTGTDLSIMERYIVGETVAQLFPPSIKLAVVWPEEDINRFAETVAVNRGVFVRVFPDIATAEHWLLTPSRN